MRRLICFTMLLLVSQAMATAAEKTSIEVLRPLVRTALFGNDKGNPFELKECPVEGLWESLEIVILHFRMLDENGAQYNDGFCLYHKGELSGFVPSFGGSGLMSAVLIEDKLYYSYSGGSGIHRSHTGQLTVEYGRISMIESEPCYSCDYFLTKVDGRVQVQSGQFEAFNSWKYNDPVGFLKLEESQFLHFNEFMMPPDLMISRLIIVDDDGNERSFQKDGPIKWPETPQPWIVVSHDDVTALPGLISIR